jgi:hypothetical protein
MFRACDRAAAFQPGSERDTARANSRDARGGVLVAERRNASCAGERSVVPHPRCALTFEVRANQSEENFTPGARKCAGSSFVGGCKAAGVIFRDEESPREPSLASTPEPAHGNESAESALPLTAPGFVHHAVR